MSFKNYKITITDKFIETLIKLNINPGFNATKDWAVSSPKCNTLTT